ncbi:MAG: ATP-binding protein [Nanoarchaeota archaeon]
MYAERFLERKLKKYIKRREIIAVVGPRQSGKTTLLRHLFESLSQAVFLDFEDRETLELFNEDIKSFAELYVRNNNYLFIDEFQYAKEGGKNLKYIYDTYKIKIFISGSSISGLSIQGIKYLAGRVFVFNLYPFSFEEYLNFKEPKLYQLYAKREFAKRELTKPAITLTTKPVTKPITDKIIPFFNEFCVFGGYPRVVLAKNKEEKEIVLKNIYNTYFLREIREVLNLPEDYRLSKLIHALALQTGNVINYAELSEISGFAYADLLSYMNVLEKTFICLRSRPFYTNKRTELMKAPKIFFFDNGFRNLVVKNFQPAKDRLDKGQLYENFVASELVKRELEIKYWRTKAKAEVDFIIEQKGRVIPLEIKSGLKKPKLSKSFLSFISKYKPKQSLILSETLSTSLSTRKGNVYFRPIFAVGRI